MRLSPDIKQLNDNNPTLLGKYILESISIGMYDHPFMAIREYIQNSTDAIDGNILESDASNKSQMQEIDITIDGRKGNLVIKDNGPGINVLEAKSTLHNLGISKKDPYRNRGFRGIGRLGGLGYCDELKLITKAAGEAVFSTSIWDCQKLRYTINENKCSEDAAQIIDKITEFKQDTYIGDKSDSFFIIEMANIRNSKNLLLNVPAIRSYISQVAPIPFHPLRFRFGQEIDKVLRSRIPNYNTYIIRVNNEQIFKPYEDQIIAGTNDNKQKIKQIQYFILSNNVNELAFGWTCDLDLVGRIRPDTMIDGLRLRMGNIMLGNKDIFAEFFRERRFSSYLAGEVHIVDSRLIPNARRDDIEDSQLKDDLYNSFIKEIGIPYSKEIRDRSKIRSKQKIRSDINGLFEQARNIINNGYIAEAQRTTILNALANSQSLNECRNGDEVKDLINGVSNAKHVLEFFNGSLPKLLNESYVNIFELIYHELESKQEAEKLIRKICRGLAGDHPDKHMPSER